MNVLWPLGAGLLILLVAARTYPFYLSRLLGVDDSKPTPATTSPREPTWSSRTTSL
jgi:carbon starvation protein CstA